MISKFSISFKSSVLLILFITVLFNIINFIMFDAPNRCEMTYMFQKPQFIVSSIRYSNSYLTIGYILANIFG